MTVKDYLKNKLLMLLLHGTGIFLLFLYLTALGNRTATVLIIAVFWGFVLVTWMAADYYRRNKWFRNIDDLMEHLDHPYLIQEFLPETWYLEDNLYRQILQKSNRAVIEHIHQLEEDQKEYREFIEGWIHEVKLPITGIRLAAHSLNPEFRRRIESYLTELDNDVEQALFFARSDQVYKDYIIQETKLQPLISKLLQKNKYLLISNRIPVETDCGETTVFTDSKWIEFILGQILLNAVKYRNEEQPLIRICAKKTAGGIRLSVRDNGIGIPEDELPKVFNKGFTGTNGRNLGKSTGIGLYLCKKLCRKLGLEIIVESEQHKYTEVSLIFPKSTYLSKL